MSPKEASDQHKSEDQEAKILALQKALIAGESSGRAKDFDINDFITRKMNGGRGAARTYLTM